MPNRDGTGPWGDGRPGRGMGPCGKGREARCGRGFGRWGGGIQRRMRGSWMAPASDPVDDRIYSYDKESLKARKTELEEQIKWIEDRLNEE